MSRGMAIVKSCKKTWSNESKRAQLDRPVQPRKGTRGKCSLRVISARKIATPLVVRARSTSPERCAWPNHARLNLPNTRGYGSLHFACSRVVFLLRVACKNFGKDGRGIMGRKEQRERERKRAAASSQSLQTLGFLPAKRAKELDALPSQWSSEALPLSQDAPVVDNTESMDACSSRSILPQQDDSTSTSSSSRKPGNSQSAPSPEYDIGRIFRRANARTGEKCQKAVSELSDGEKYGLLKHHRNSPEELPTTFLAGCKRSFQPSWLAQYPWMVYSEEDDGVYCISCALFCRSRISKGQFVNTPFRTWHKKSEKCKDHQSAGYHQESLDLAHQFKLRIEKPEAGVVALVNNRIAENIQRNRTILKAIADAVLYCGRQCIALRGHRERLDGPGNHGNFLSLLQLIGRYDSTLQDHLSSPAMAGVTYMSPQTQNELLDVIGRRIILRHLLEEIKTAKFFTVLADEVTATNMEHLAICVRFVDRRNDIREI